MARLCVGCGGLVPLETHGAEDRPVGGYCSKRCYMHHYNARRTRERQAAQPREVVECPGCQASWSKVPGFIGRTYCSSRCRDKVRLAAARKEPRLITCQQCNEVFTSARLDARFCAKRCSSRWQREHAPTGCSVAGCPRPLRAKGMCNTHYRKARGERQQGWNDRRRDNYHRRRALKKRVTTGDPVSLAYIRERDRDRCHLCGKRIGKRAWPHPLSPSLDHVIPLTKGGGHDSANVRLAHLACNSAKGNRGGGEQLMLIG